MRVLTIGDIHGCNVALVTLLKEVQPTPEDQIIFLGDYIDGGTASRAVIDTLLKLKQAHTAVFLRGNHEVMIMDAREDTLKPNPQPSYAYPETLYSYGTSQREDWVAAIPAAHWEFFESTLRFFENDRHIFVHACLDPELALDEQPDEILFWEVFNRLQPHKTGKRIICGHTEQRSGQIKDAGFAVCIDTGVAIGGWLTCLDVNSGKFWQANEKGDTWEGALKQK
jgi:serine/threonine protein phosphatase 1